METFRVSFWFQSRQRLGFTLFASNQYQSLRIQSWRNNLRYNHNIITDETPYNIFRKYHWKTYKITPKIAFFIKVFSFVFFVPKKRIIFAKVQRRKRGKIGLLYHLSFKLLVINWSNMLHRQVIQRKEKHKKRKYKYNTSVNFYRKFKNLTIESDKVGSSP